MSFAYYPLAAALLLLLLLSQLNEAFASNARSKDLASTMSVEAALDLVSANQDATTELTSFLQETLSHKVAAGSQHPHPHHGHNKHHGHSRHFQHGHHLRHAHSHLAHSSRHVHQKSLNQDKAQVRGATENLNQMLSKLDREKTLEQVKCAEFQTTHKALLETMRQDMSAFNSQGADAEAEILRTTSAIDTAKVRGSNTKESLSTHSAKCETDQAAMRSEMQIVLQDIDVMTRVLQESSCAQSVQLLQCQQSGESFLAIGHKALSSHLANLKSDLARQALQEGLASLQNQRNESQVPVVTDPPLDYETVTRKCTMSASPSCEDLRMKFLAIQAGIAEKKEQLNSQLVALGHECKSMADTFNAEVANLESRLREEETNLATATKEKSQAEEMTRLKHMEAVKLMGEYQKGTKNCQENLKNFDEQICGVEKIRGELQSLGGGATTNIQDCEESDWTEEECSVPCGGGSQILTRSIIVHPEGGRECGPLQMQRPCNEVPCPTDCSLDDWGGWSACTASCGQGVRTRVRQMLTSAANGGKPCPVRQETEACNVEACDASCELGDWSGFSGCDKMCNTGFQTRIRGVASAATGSGSCPAADSEQRLEMLPCNTQSCDALAAQAPNGILQCHSKVDIVLVLDGSSSLGTTGWSSMKSAASELAANMVGGDDKVKVGALLYSSPVTYANYEACLKDGLQGLTPADCGVSWVSHLSTDSGAVSTAINNMQWPQGGKMTSTALAMASAEMEHGRSDAGSIVMVFTDGPPESSMNAKQMARRLREKGVRLMFIPLTYKAPVALYEEWASAPIHENVIQVLDVADLLQHETLNDIMADTCSIVSR